MSKIESTPATPITEEMRKPDEIEEALKKYLVSTKPGRYKIVYDVPSENMQPLFDILAASGWKLCSVNSTRVGLNDAGTWIVPDIVGRSSLPHASGVNLPTHKMETWVVSRGLSLSMDSCLAVNQKQPEQGEKAEDSKKQHHPRCGEDDAIPLKDKLRGVQAADWRDDGRDNRMFMVAPTCPLRLPSNPPH